MQKPTSPAGILIIEDNADLCLALALFLQDLGFPTVMAANGQEALSQLRSAPLPALILLDLIMPVMNGWVFRDEQRQDPRLAVIPVVIMSGADDLLFHATALEAVACLIKPVDLNDLLGLVAMYCH